MLLSEQSVAVTVRDLADGTVTARDLVAACAWRDRDDAFTAACQADARRASAQLLPLLGLPVAVDAGVRDASSARAAGAIVMGTVRDAAAALDMGAFAAIGRPDGTTPSWRPAGTRDAILTRETADLPLLGLLLGVTTPPVDRLDEVRIGAHGDRPAVAEAATRLSLSGLRVADVERRRFGRFRGTDPTDVLITTPNWPVPRTHAAVTVPTPAPITLLAPRSAEHVALRLAALLAAD